MSIEVLENRPKELFSLKFIYLSPILGVILVSHKKQKNKEAISPFPTIFKPWFFATIQDNSDSLFLFFIIMAMHIQSTKYKYFYHKMVASSMGGFFVEWELHHWISPIP